MLHSNELENIESNIEDMADKFWLAVFYISLALLSVFIVAVL